MKNWIINVSGRHGYSFMVETDIENDSEVICAAKKANLFEDAEDADYAFADDLVSQYDIDHFKKSNAYHKI